MCKQADFFFFFAICKSSKDILEEHFQATWELQGLFKLTATFCLIFIELHKKKKGNCRF